MNTQFLTDFKAALVALLAVINSTNSPVAPSQPSLWPAGTITNSLVESTTIDFITLTNTNLFVRPTANWTNWIDDETLKLLATSSQVCRVRGHIWAGGCGMMGCLVIHPDPMRYCRLCGKTETRTVSEFK